MSDYKSVDLHSCMTVGINDFINNQSIAYSNNPQNTKSCESELDDVNNSDPCTSNSAAHVLNSRRLPSRVCKENNAIHKTKLCPVMKPKRLLSKSGDLRPAEIKKIYLNKQLGNFHPSKLETIFEPLTTGNGDDCELRLIGTRKVKRSISCSDGVNVNKTLIKKRRLKIKKNFGKCFSFKKILLEDFMQRLNKSFEESIAESIDLQNDKSEESELDVDNALLNSDPCTSYDDINENLSSNRCLLVRSPKTNCNLTTMVDYKSVDFLNNQSTAESSDPQNAKSDESELDIDNGVNNSDPCTSNSAAHVLNIRRQPSRACKDNNAIHKTKRRRFASSGDIKNLT